MKGTGWTRLPAGLSLCAALSLVVFPATVYFLPGPFDAIDAKIYDAKLDVRGPIAVDPRIVHLDVDDRSVMKYGMWPWDREIGARIVDRLTLLGARAAVFDIFFPSAGKSPSGDETFFTSMKTSGRVLSATGLVITRTGDRNEKIRTEAEDKSRALYRKAWPVLVPEPFALWRTVDLPDSKVPLVPVIKNSQYVGHIVSTPDRDGVHRRIPLLVTFKDRCLPALSLAALVSCLGTDPKNVLLTDAGRVSVEHRSGVLTIPVDSDGSMAINWPEKRESFRSYSVADLLADESEPALKDSFKDKIVIIAYSATGTTDIGVSPLYSQFLLSRIHSSALNTMLTGQFLTRIDEFPLVVPMASLTSILFALVCVRIRHRYGILLVFAICGLYGVLVMVAFLRWSCDIPTAAPLMLFAVSTTTFLVARAVSMESRTDRISHALERYLSPHMLHSIVARDRDIDLSTRRKELTILFVDIKGFSTISETLDVEYLESFLNEFLDAMTRSVFDNHGTVDKFLGDGLLAFFGDPVELDNHALAAVRSAVQMQRELENLNRKWSAAGIDELAHGIRIRIGINTGIVVVGNVGSQRRMEYTVIGSAVNVAGRLQEIAPPGGVLLSARTRALAKNNLRCKEPQTIKVKGVERPITVYELESVV
ncbi:MAG: adenylate/guanylate cyclase domain-containing protein [Desulfomonilaceae bacterium]|nr:adenylate/guanylate cyclase domain-containing protein [Desulfomonilaceae bacterium]